VVVVRKPRKERVPVAQGFSWGVGRKSKIESTCCLGIIGGGSKGNQEREGSSSPGFCWGKEEKPGGRGYLLHWFFGGEVVRETRMERVPVARAFVGVRKRNQEGEGTCCTGFLVEG
jgi:hypothetical protein